MFGTIYVLGIFKPRSCIKNQNDNNGLRLFTGKDLKNSDKKQTMFQCFGKKKKKKDCQLQRHRLFQEFLFTIDFKVCPRFLKICFVVEVFFFDMKQKELSNITLKITGFKVDTRNEILWFFQFLFCLQNSKKKILMPSYCL